MDLFERNLGRRRFIKVSSMVLGAGMLTKPSRLLFAADRSSQVEGSAESDGTKYGKYIESGYREENQDPERGIFIAQTDKNVIPGCPLGRFVRMPGPGPMPGHGSHERHEVPEYLIHLGNDPDDPMDLGAEVEFYLGRGKWREKYVFTKSTAIYLPTGFWHCPWHIKKIWKPMTFVNVMVGETDITLSGGPAPGEGGQAGPPPGEGGRESQGGPPGMMMQELSEEELARAKTSNYIFNKFMISGVGRDMKDPKSGKWIAYTDCTKIAEAPLTRIIRYSPEEAPYSILDTQTHEYGTFLVLLGTDYDDPFDLGAEVDLYIGPEKEKHTITQSSVAFIPADLVHGPMKVKKAQRPFNFLEIVIGPELPGAVYG